MIVVLSPNMVEIYRLNIGARLVCHCYIYAIIQTIILLAYIFCIASAPIPFARTVVSPFPRRTPIFFFFVSHFEIVPVGPLALLAAIVRGMVFAPTTILLAR
jgi:hypothetical protein